MTKSRAVAATANDNSIPGSRLVDESITSTKIDGTLSTDQVSYDALEGGVERTLSSKLEDVKSVLDFGADPTGATGSSAAIDAAIKASSRVTFPPGTYLIDSTIFITSSVTIDFCGSTLIRGTTGRLFFVTGGNYLKLYNGTIDGLNSGGNRGQLIRIEAPATEAVMRDMTFLNNCAGYPTPIANQDTDHVLVAKAKRFTADNCVFRIASRQGISVTARCPEVIIRGCTFEDCYHFGIDIEPNSPETHMYESVIIDGNNFVNCGTKSETDKVWDGGNGPVDIAAGETSISFIRNIIFSNNRIISTDFFSVSLTLVEPFIRIRQYETLNFTGNTVINLNRGLIGSGSTVHKRSVFSGNNFYGLPGGMSGNIDIIGAGGDLIISGNSFTSVDAGATSQTITGNYFTGELRLTSAAGPATINGNVFSTSGTCINTTGKSSEMVIVGNNSNNDTVFIGPTTLTDSVVASNRYQGTVA